MFAKVEFAAFRPGQNEASGKAWLDHCLDLKRNQKRERERKRKELLAALERIEND